MGERVYLLFSVWHPPLQFQASQNQSHSATFNPLGPQEDQFALCREACWVSLHVGRHHIYI